MKGRSPKLDQWFLTLFSKFSFIFNFSKLSVVVHKICKKQRIKNEIKQHEKGKMKQDTKR